MDAVRERDGTVTLRVRVQPRASRNGVSIAADGSVRVALTAPPVEGAANRALRAFMATLLGISKSHVTIAGGEKAREKTLELAGVDASQVRERLSGAC